MEVQTKSAKFWLTLCAASILGLGGWALYTFLQRPRPNQPNTSASPTSSAHALPHLPRQETSQAAPPASPPPAPSASNSTVTSASRTQSSKLIEFSPATTRPEIEGLEPIQRQGRNAEEGPARYDRPDEAAEFFRLKRAPAGETIAPLERYLTARDEMQSMPRYSTAQNAFLSKRYESQNLAEASALGAWTSLGPGNVGGRTRTLLIHPTTPEVMYAAGVSGGVWKTTNGGAAWTPLADLLANIAVNSLAMDPTNPNVIYAGTGEGYFNGDAARGLGIFKTTDGGHNWTQLSSTITSDFFFVNDLVMSPNNSQRIYAATRTGVWRSSDGGASWTRVLDPAINGGCLDLAIRTDQTTDYLFAACGTVAGIASNISINTSIYRNRDASGAGTWDRVFTQLGAGRISLAVAPSNQNIVYALAASGEVSPLRHGLYAVYRSTASGDLNSWTPQVRNTDANKLNTVLLSNPLAAFFSECGFGPSQIVSQGWYDNAIAVDPVDADRVWAGGIDLFRSDDGGVNWGQASHWWIDQTAPQYAHSDQHIIVFHPQYDGTTNKTMFVGNDGGLFRTDDARAAVATNTPSAVCQPSATGVAWTRLNHGYGVTQFYHGAPYPDGQSYFGGTQDNGTLRGSDSSGSDGWREIFGGDGGFVAVDPRHPNTLYAETVGLSIRKSDDGGATFHPARVGINDGGLFTTPFAMDPSDGQRLWTGGLFLWRTSNGAAQWQQASRELNAPISALAVSPTDANYVLVGKADGSILRSDSALAANANTTWPSALPRFGFVSWVTFDPLNKNIAYATYTTFGGTHIWRSVDGGASWTGIDGIGAGKLPDVPVNCIVVDPSNTARLYAGTDLGVFVSLDGGASWAIENTGFANVIVSTLQINTAGGAPSLYAFTFGRGVWRIGLGSSVCTHQLSSPGQNFNASGGSGALNVTAVSGNCGWTAESNASWITITASSNGDNGTVSYAVAANPTFSARAGTLTMAGRSFVVTQEAALDTTPPVVTITGPTSASTFQSGLAKISLSGTVTDNDRVTEVKWANEHGGSGNANGTSSWMIEEVRLGLGLNKITITARDASGNLGTATLTINYGFGGTLVPVAGTGNTEYNGDDRPALTANLDNAGGLAVDAAGNLYIADENHHRIRKVAPNGMISTIAGNGVKGFGGDGGAATSAQLFFPRGIALDPAGNLYIADQGNHRIRKVSTDGLITTICGDGGAAFGGDGGPASAAQLNSPTVLISDPAGNLYIGDLLNHRVRKITASTGLITTVAGNGTDGINGNNVPATEAQLAIISGLALDNDRNLYIADEFGKSIRKVNASTGLINRVVGQEFNATGDGKPAITASLSRPQGIFFDRTGNLYIADFNGGRVRKVDAATGIINTIAGGDGITGNTPLPPAAVSLGLVRGFALDAAGQLLIGEARQVWKLVPFSVPDTTPPMIKITSPTTQPTYTTADPFFRLAGTATDDSLITHIIWSNDRGGRGNAVPSLARTVTWDASIVPLQLGLNHLTVTAWDIDGNSTSATLAVTLTATKFIRTLAGNNQVAGFSGENSASLSAQLRTPETVVVDAQGNLYITDTGNHRIRKITPNGIITSVAGSGALGSSGDGGPAAAAAMNQPGGLAIDPQGNLYIADTGNHRVRKVNASGLIATVAGTGHDGLSGDGGAATSAQLDAPTGLALDNAGNLYIADTNNHRIRKVAPNGIITTVAGTGYGFGGDGGAATSAQLKFPTGVAVNAQGHLFIADTDNQRIRKVDAATGLISTIAGNGTAAFGSDEVPAISAMVNVPGGLSLDSAGNLYIAEREGNRIRKISTNGLITTVVYNFSIGLPSPDASQTFSLHLNGPGGVAVDRAGNFYIADTGHHRVLLLTAYRTSATVQAASFVGSAIARESLVSVFGANLATGSGPAASLPLPTTLAGTTIKVRDSLDVERPAPLLFVSPTQINYQIPPGTADGPASVLITSGDGQTSTSILPISAVAPGLFTANSDGQGAPAAIVQHVRADGSQSFDLLAVYDSAQQKYLPRPIDLGPEGDLVALLLFGTGLRHRSALSDVTVRLGDEYAEVLYAGAQPDFVGLDQINVLLPRSLIGSGEVDLVLTVDGQTANVVKVKIGGSACNKMIAPANQAFASSGGQGSVNVTAANGCYWSARSETSWITITSNTQGSGNAAVIYTVAANTSAAPRTGTLRIAGQTLTVTQAGASDSAAPVVTITSPTSTGAFTISVPTINLGGTAASGAGIAFITWRDERGNGGTASGASGWAITNLPLQVGVNLITVTAYDVNGLAGTAQLTVNLVPTHTVTTVAGGGLILGDDGPATAAEVHPNALAFDRAGNLFIAEFLRVRKVTPAGIITTIASNTILGSAATQLLNAAGLTTDRAGNVYVADQNNNRIWKIDAATGNITPFAGRGDTGNFPPFVGDGGPATAATLNTPTDVVFDAAGNLYIADSGFNRIRKVDASTGLITTVAGGGTQGLGDGGPATAAQIGIARSIAFDSAGHLYIATGLSCRLRKVEAITGIITTVAGSGAQTPGGDGGLATAAATCPFAVTVDQADNLYLVESSTSTIRKIDAASRIITTIAGTGSTGFNGDGGPAITTQLWFPRDVAFDGAGHLHIADSGNNRVRKLVPFSSSSISTLLKALGISN